MGFQSVEVGVVGREAVADEGVVTNADAVAFGNQDGTVEWWQSTVFYNYARRAGKQMVLLVYEGENHGFTQKPDQVDYHRRILEWFGYYLKGEPAPKWITDGVRFEDLNAEKKRVASPPTVPAATEARVSP